MGVAGPGITRAVAMSGEICTVYGGGLPWTENDQSKLSGTFSLG